MARQQKQPSKRALLLCTVQHRQGMTGTVQGKETLRNVGLLHAMYIHKKKCKGTACTLQCSKPPRSIHRTKPSTTLGSANTAGFTSISAAAAAHHHMLYKQLHQRCLNSGACASTHIGLRTGATCWNAIWHGNNGQGKGNATMRRKHRSCCFPSSHQDNTSTAHSCLLAPYTTNMPA